MALTTPISEYAGNWRRPSPRAIVPPKMWFGHDVPDHVMAIEMRRNLYDELEAHWRVKGTTEVHTMPFKQTDEGVMAVLVAMKLTC